MKAVSSGHDTAVHPDHNSAMDAIESFKKRNIERNIKQVFKQMGEKERKSPSAQQPRKQLAAPPELRQENEEEEHMHEIEDYENMGHVVNLCIGDQAKQDFFFRSQKADSSSKPPMPGKQLQQRRNTGTANTGFTPERAGMMRPPRANELRQTGTGSTVMGSTASSGRNWSDKQKLAAQMRQNALKYGNSRRNLN